MDRLKIPPLALLGLSVFACKDDANPIVGTWDATLIDGMAYPVTVVEGYSFAVDLVIEDDLTGTYNFREMYAGYSEVGSYALTVNDDAAPKYTIAIPEAELTLSCTVSGAQLSCTDQEMIEYRFKRR